jgi:acyl carrier protein
MVTTEDILRLVEAGDLAVNASELKADVPLVKQGFDSLDVATLVLQVETKYKKDIPLEQAARLRTLKDIVDFLNA